MVVYTRLVIVVGASGGMEGSINYIVVSTRETNTKVYIKFDQNQYICSKDIEQNFFYKTLMSTKGHNSVENKISPFTIPNHSSQYQCLLEKFQENS